MLEQYIKPQLKFDIIHVDLIVKVDCLTECLKQMGFLRNLLNKGSCWSVQVKKYINKFVVFTRLMADVSIVKYFFMKNRKDAKP